MIGLSALAEPLDRVVHRWGDLPPGPLAGLLSEPIWGWPHFLALLTGPGGYLDRVPSEIPTVLALSQIGDLGDSIGLFGFVAEAMAHPRVPLVLFCELDRQRRNLRTVYRTVAAPERPGER
jgi:hypothetical protein